MTKITWIGKDEKEVQTAARILCNAASAYGGKHSLVVPSLDPASGKNIFMEHTIIDSKPIQFASSSVSDFIFVFDEALISAGTVPLYESGTLVVNTPILGYRYGKYRRILPLDASEIASSATGKKQIYSVFLGVFTALSGVLPFEAVVSGIKDHFAENADRQISLFAVSYGIVLEGSSL